MPSPARAQQHCHQRLPRVGPAIAGVLVAAIGPWLVFILNAFSYIGVFVVLLQWQREHHKSTLPAERFLSAIRVGVRVVMHTRALLIVLIRGSAFFVFASATWSLFPLIVRQELGRGPEVYGLLLTCIGVGAVGGALLLPLPARAGRGSPRAVARRRKRSRRLARAWRTCRVACGRWAPLATGVAWISILSALQVAAQLTLPPWVRARGLAAFVVVFMGGMALGSILWGQVATGIGIPAALTTAAAGMVLAIAVTWRFKLGHHEVLDFTPSMDYPMPVLAETPEPDVPVMVTITYRTQPDKRAEFVAAMQGVREMRRRNGAYFLAALPRLGGPHALRGNLHGRILDGAPAPTRTRECRRSGGSASREAVSGRRRIDEILALAGRSRVLTGYRESASTGCYHWSASAIILHREPRVPVPARRNLAMSGITQRTRRAVVAGVFSLVVSSALAGEILVACYSDGNECEVTQDLAKRLKRRIRTSRSRSIKCRTRPSSSSFRCSSPRRGPGHRSRHRLGGLSKYYLDITPYVKTEVLGGEFWPTLPWMRQRRATRASTA
jgi:hypothetical protein